MSSRPQTALVTGATSGIGEALARLLATKGFHLILSGRNTDKLSAFAAELQQTTEVTWIAADLAKPEQRHRLIDLMHADVPQLVVNNAGVGLYGPILDRDIEKEMEVLYTNVEAVMELTIEAAKAMVKAGKKGTIMNVSSAAAFQPYPGSTVYAASKGFVNLFSEGFDAEVRGKGVRVLAACPGFVDTNFRQRAGGAHTPISSMTADYSAEQIWLQIQKGIPIRIFDWKYRTAIFFGKFIPNRLVSQILRWWMRRSLTTQQPKGTP